MELVRTDKFKKEVEVITVSAPCKGDEPFSVQPPPGA
jgi:hypothetical protein